MSIYKVWIEVQEYDDEGEDAVDDSESYYGPFAFETQEQAMTFAMELEHINLVHRPGFLPHLSYTASGDTILPAFWEESPAVPPPPVENGIFPIIGNEHTTFNTPAVDPRQLPLPEPPPDPHFL